MEEDAIVKRGANKSMKLRLALKMVYLESCQRARNNGEVLLTSNSPVSSSAPSREA